jgi:hypothetical protein
MIASLGYRRLAVLAFALVVAAAALAAPWASQYVVAKWVAAVCVAVLLAALLFSLTPTAKRLRTGALPLIVVGLALALTIGANLLDLPRALLAGGNYPLKRNESLQLVDLAHNDPQLQIRTEAYALYWLKQHLDGAMVVTGPAVTIVADRWRQYAHVASVRGLGEGEAVEDRIDPASGLAADLQWAKDVGLEVYLAPESRDQYFLRYKPDAEGVLQLFPLVPEGHQS